MRKALLLVTLVMVLEFVASCKETTEPIVNQEQCATPVFTPGAGEITSGQSVSIACATVGAAIVYTTDGSDPTSNSAVYTSPIAINETTTVKAQAYRTGWTNSAIATASYSTIPPANMVHVAGGTFNNGTSDVTLSSFYISK